MRKIDYHIHPNYSFDATGSIAEYIESALAKGLESIAFTTHIDLNPARKICDQWMRIDGHFVRLSNSSIANYIDNVKHYRKQYADLIEILIGFEISYGKHFESDVRNFIENYPCDFRIGSLHCLENMGFNVSTEKHYFAKYDVRKFMRIYAENLVALSESHLFNTLGHIDGYRKYLSKLWDRQQLIDAENEFFPPALEKLAQLNQGIEINSSAQRKGLGEFYPSRSVLELIKSANVAVNSFGSDAHKPADVGYMFDEAMALLHIV
jgi:histidinol-phosphatase (PHP family)